MKEVLKSFFCSNGDKTRFRPSFFWVTLIMLGLIAAVIVEIIEGGGKRTALIGILIGSALSLLGVYNLRKVKDKTIEMHRGYKVDGTPKG